jgi:hypothetical protein
MKNWLTQQITRLMISTANVEKNALGQTKETLESDLSKHQRHTQGQLADSLINAEITEEVLNLKWRTYKILKASQGVTSKIVGYDEDNMPIVKTVKTNNKKGLNKIKTDPTDKYKLEMVLNNSEITINTVDSLGDEDINIFDSVLENYGDNGVISSVSHGKISANELIMKEKGDKPIKIIRTDYPNFLIENYTKKLNVKKITNNKKLLEFYVSKYQDEYNKHNNLFINAIEKNLKGKKQSFLDFEGVEFITYKTVGVDDFLLFKYNNIEFDKIIEFDGHYVIKFKADVLINGKDIFEEHKVEKLEEKYKNKEKK